jgi:hypothetical protein
MKNSHNTDNKFLNPKCAYITITFFKSYDPEGLGHFESGIKEVSTACCYVLGTSLPPAHFLRAGRKKCTDVHPQYADQTAPDKPLHRKFLYLCQCYSDITNPLNKLSFFGT